MSIFFASSTLFRSKIRLPVSRETTRRASEWAKSYLGSDKNGREGIITSELLPYFSTGDDLSMRSSTVVGQALSKTKGGFSTAMKLREDISRLIISTKKDSSLAVPEKDTTLRGLKSLDDSIRTWLSVLLSVDTLQLKRVTFDFSSGDVLEKVARGESVHRVRSLGELKRRLHDGRRCFALFHHCLPEDPLVFVHVGLTARLAESLGALDQFKAEEAPSCAMFYSINSPHAALSGLDLASQLLKEALPVLQHQFPTLSTFSTLSPIPQFMAWLAQKAKAADGLVMPPVHLQALRQLAATRGVATESASAWDTQAAVSWLHGVLADQASNWTCDQGLRDGLRGPVLWLGSHYIAREKLRKADGRGLPLDPVSRFHLRNGATFLHINWLGNPSSPGLQSSAGMMANYQYHASAEAQEQQAAAFERQPEDVILGPVVQRILSV